MGTKRKKYKPSTYRERTLVSLNMKLIPWWIDQKFLMEWPKLKYMREDLIQQGYEILTKCVQTHKEEESKISTYVVQALKRGIPRIAIRYNKQYIVPYATLYRRELGMLPKEIRIQDPGNSELTGSYTMDSERLLIKAEECGLLIWDKQW